MQIQRYERDELMTTSTQIQIKNDKDTELLSLYIKEMYSIVVYLSKVYQLKADKPCLPGSSEAISKFSSQHNLEICEGSLIYAQSFVTEKTNALPSKATSDTLDTTTAAAAA
jgi:hypothetical protein